LNICAIPFSSAAFLTSCDPGTTTAVMFGATFFPFTIFAAISKSANLPFVQDPINTCFNGMS
jgi:hypothetical protein